ncbi:MAG: hypothetical protein M3Q84_07005, partial [Actinomycetota bacterium]|nr:hypothetical protein [Actinomycetota bacterium]
MNGLLDEVDELRRPGSLVGQACEQPLVQDPPDAPDARQVLAQVVVQVLPDTLALALAGLEDLARRQA